MSEIRDFKMTGSGGELAIEPSNLNDGHAFIFGRLHVAPHSAAGICRALYRAMGLPIPDLPDLPDPEEVRAFAEDLSDAIEGARTGIMPGYPDLARDLLARGYRKCAGGDRP